jgi:hypothetical protein
VGHKTVSSWFDSGCFTTTTLTQALANGQPLGTRRNILDAPGLNNLDLSLMKDSQFGERLKLEFRAEAHNLFNQAHFGFPVFTVGNPNIGQVGGASDGGTYSSG